MTNDKTELYARLDQWIDAHFEEEVQFLQSVIQVPTDTPPGNNAPHAERTAALLADLGMMAEQHAVPAEDVHAGGMESITNLIVRRQYAEGGKVLALNAHGDVVPPGEGWTYPPYGGEVHDGKIYGRASAVSKSDFATYVYAVRALESLGAPLAAVKIMNVLYALNAQYQGVYSNVAGITHPYLNIGLIQGGTNTNVIPGKVVLKMDRRMIPEEDPAQVEADLVAAIEHAAAPLAGIRVNIRRILFARALRPLPGNAVLVSSLQRHGQALFGEAIPAVGTPLYADARLYGEAGVPVVLYGAGPRTVEESRAKQTDERLELEDLRRATKVVARTCLDLMLA